jgi:hypothetical protein
LTPQSKAPLFLGIETPSSSNAFWTYPVLFPCSPLYSCNPPRKRFKFSSLVFVPLVAAFTKNEGQRLKIQKNSKLRCHFGMLTCQILYLQAREPKMNVKTECLELGGEFKCIDIIRPFCWFDEKCMNPLFLKVKICRKREQQQRHVR